MIYIYNIHIYVYIYASNPQFGEAGLGLKAMEGEREREILDGSALNTDLQIYTFHIF